MNTGVQQTEVYVAEICDADKTEKTRRQVQSTMGENQDVSMDDQNLVRKKLVMDSSQLNLDGMDPIPKQKRLNVGIVPIGNTSSMVDIFDGGTESKVIL